MVVAVVVAVAAAAAGGRVVELPWEELPS